MKTQFARTVDRTRIAYDICGEGPGLFLLHGMPEGREQWHESGYVEQLQHYFTVVTMDMRGFGESDAPLSPDAYALGHILGDVDRVAESCELDRFLIWG